MNKNNSISDILYNKTYECPVCHSTFTSKAIKSRKNKLISTDSDLYNRFNNVNPIIYDVILCECGYAALSNNFHKLRSKQIKWIKESIISRYNHRDYPDILSEEDAIERYKLALLNASVKKASNGEKGYICLKIGWLYRDLKDKESERTYLEHARQYFLKAFSSESFPIFELDELTTMYLIAELSRKIGDYDTAMRWVSELITKPSTPNRLKDRALELRDNLKNKY